MNRQFMQQAQQLQARLAKAQEELANMTIEVTSGGGSVTPTKVITDANGFAGLDSWILGPDPGENIVTARVSNLAPVESRSIKPSESLGLV